MDWFYPERLRRNRTQDKEDEPRMNANTREEMPRRPAGEPVRRAQGPELAAGRRPYSACVTPHFRPVTLGNLAEKGRS